MYFHKPSDVKDTAFTVYKYAFQGDDRWMFIPAINLVKRIAANDKYSSFVGSDFTYFYHDWYSARGGEDLDVDFREAIRVPKDRCG